MIRIVTLAENTAGGRGMLAEHGLSFWIQKGSMQILFDTGQGKVILKNARQLEINLRRVEAIVLSHGHYDHTGGLNSILQKALGTKIYAHPAAFQPKFGRDDNGTVHDIGTRKLDKEKVHESADMLVWTKSPTEIGASIFVTGEIPRVTDFEETGEQFYSDIKCKKSDTLIDDQAIFMQSSQGIIVLLGCAHAGVINTLKYIHQLTDKKAIHAVLGGMHLVHASERRIDRTIKALRQFNIERLGFAHCTGFKAMAKLWTAFPGKCFHNTVGTDIDFAL